MVAVAITSISAVFGEQVNYSISRRSCLLSRDSVTVTVASAALGGGTP